ncbi:uncharacterized protein AMSG_02002 [Thecamonas trahens ATCC 50062]|uniref:TOG domain-containing protein n=1 Tax=Thecamonas trahens ATCC 50062 TaxID=461836 RepID=A0A0L0DUH8_THETB|nr:hypothetical protein AMSG_02002 [Thecamonas trahens ATCC 50062]KNC55989.1 hypothetical protein AMSG_02002 [Thecamonas trahens ATCC 50062]|eukprot:XP_013761035.1 hypothetical protein AMSG_02002 [Thecamonas trahens ATCC 50062]
MSKWLSKSELDKLGAAAETAGQGEAEETFAVSFDVASASANSLARDLTDAGSVLSALTNDWTKRVLALQFVAAVARAPGIFDAQHLHALEAITSVRKAVADQCKDLRSKVPKEATAAILAMVRGMMAADSLTISTAIATTDFFVPHLVAMHTASKTALRLPGTETLAELVATGTVGSSLAHIAENVSHKSTNVRLACTTSIAGMAAAAKASTGIAADSLASSQAVVETAIKTALGDAAPDVRTAAKAAALAYIDALPAAKESFMASLDPTSRKRLEKALGGGSSQPPSRRGHRGPPRQRPRPGAAALKRKRPLRRPVKSAAKEIEIEIFVAPPPPKTAPAPSEASVDSVESAVDAPAPKKRKSLGAPRRQLAPATGSPTPQPATEPQPMELSSPQVAAKARRARRSLGAPRRVSGAADMVLASPPQASPAAAGAPKETSARPQREAFKPSQGPSRRMSLLTGGARRAPVRRKPSGGEAPRRSRASLSGGGMSAARRIRRRPAPATPAAAAAAVTALAAVSEAAKENASPERVLSSTNVLVERSSSAVKKPLAPVEPAQAPAPQPAAPKTPKTPKAKRRPFTVLNSPSLDSRAFNLLRTLASATRDTCASVLDSIAAAATPVKYAPVTPGPAAHARPHDS